jgi:hypothetical protein
MALAGGLEHQAAVRFHLLMILGEHAGAVGAITYDPDAVESILAGGWEGKTEILAEKQLSW